MSSPTWLSVIGCLANGALAPHAPREALCTEAVFGAERLLHAAGVDRERQRPWPRPLSAGVAAVLERRGRPTTVLASGDPLHHGIAVSLLTHLDPSEIAIYPAPSAFSLAAAAMRWPLQDVGLVSLHNAPPSEIARHVAPGRKLLVLTRDGEAPAAIAVALTGLGYGESFITVLETLPDGTRHNATAATLSGEFASLNTLAIVCRSARPVRIDDLAHDGCVTRDEVRLLTIAALGHGRGHLWDVGAGSGAVAIDWCRAGGSASLFERDLARAGAIRANLAAHGITAKLLEGDAAERLPGAAAPEAVFMGGAVADEPLFWALWERLRAGGAFVSNAVTLEGEAASIARHARHGGRLTRIALSHSGSVGALTALRPAMPVLQWRAVKP